MWTGQGRAPRLPRNWRALRIRALRRDGWQCTARLEDGTRCPYHAAEVDHREAKADDHRLAALQSLCADHHRAKTAREGAEASAIARTHARARARRPAEPHPGLVD